MYVRWLPIFLALLGCCLAAQAQAEWPHAILLAEAEDDEDEDDDDDGGGSGYVHSYSAPSFSSYSASPRHYSRARRAPRAHHAKRYARSHKAKYAQRVSRRPSAKSHHGRVHGLKHSSRKPTHGRKHHAVKTSHRQSAHKAVRNGKLRTKHHGTASRYRVNSKRHPPTLKAGVKTRTHAKYQPRPRLKHHSAAPSGKTYSRHTSKRQWVTRHSERPRTAVKRRSVAHEQRLHAKAGQKAAVSRGAIAKNPVHATPAALHGKSRPTPAPLTRRQSSAGKPSTSSGRRPETGKLRPTTPASGKPATKSAQRPISGKPGRDSRHESSTKPKAGMQASKAIGRKPGSQAETPVAKGESKSQKSRRLATDKAAKRETESTKQVKSGSRTTAKITRRQESQRVPNKQLAQPNPKKRQVRSGR